MNTKEYWMLKGYGEDSPLRIEFPWNKGDIPTVDEIYEFCNTLPSSELSIVLLPQLLKEYHNITYNFRIERI